jgi:hypothetical protein
MIAAHHDTIEKYCLVWCGKEDCQCRRQEREKYRQEFGKFVAEMGRTADPDLVKLADQFRQQRTNA